MDIHLSSNGTEPVRIFLGGRLLVEAHPSLGIASVERDWTNELASARAAQNAVRMLTSFSERLESISLIEDHTAKSQADRRQAAARGFLAGFLGETVPHGFDGVPPLPPEHGSCYRIGYDWGDALRRASRIVHEPDRAACAA